MALTVGDIREMIEDLLDSSPVHISIDGDLSAVEPSSVETIRGDELVIVANDTNIDYEECDNFCELCGAEGCDGSCEDGDHEDGGE